MDTLSISGGTSPSSSCVPLHCSGENRLGNSSPSGGVLSYLPHDTAAVGDGYPVDGYTIDGYMPDSYHTHDEGYPVHERLHL